jgi:hypothetical protein
MADDAGGAAVMAAVAAASGAAARVALALHGGVRRVGTLAVEAFVGGCLGVMASGAAIYFDPGLRDAGWALLVVGGAAGFAGALGTRLLDLAVAAAQRRVGG